MEGGKIGELFREGKCGLGKRKLQDWAVRDSVGRNIEEFKNEVSNGGVRGKGW